ncbi:hypothetical protein ACHAXR_001148, partial [Thalassiosira sp. AJA248-18]
GRNFIFKKFGQFIDSAKIAYLNSKGDDGKAKKSDDVHNMLDMFKESNKIRFTSLSDVPIDKYCEAPIDNAVTGDADTVTLSLTIDENKNVVTQQDMKSTTTLAEIEVLAKKERVARKLKKKDELFIAIAWTLMPLFRFFLLCPEVVWCDVTSHSNNKGFSLLTFSCPCHRNRVKFIMKDGDAQQRNEIIGALRNVFPNAIEGGCGYHIVNGSWTRWAPGVTSVRKGSLDSFLALKAKIMNWCYSWMKPGYVENEDEYEISKYLLLKFISSTAALNAVDGKREIIVGILRWLKGYVLPWDTLYLFHLRKKVRHYLTAHSSPYEGTNFGIKNHAAPMQATTNMTTSAKTLNLQAGIRAAELQKIAYDDFVNNDKKWSDKPTSKFTTSFGEGLFKEVYDRS